MAARFATREPQVGIQGDPGDAMVVEIDCLDDRRRLLPVIRVRRAA